MNPVHIVFSNKSYIILSVLVFVTMLIPLLMVSEYLFVEPFLILHVTEDRILGFAGIIAVSVLSGIVISMNVYRVITLQKNARTMGKGVFGSIIGAAAGACSCGPIGFALISTFGTAGGIFASFLTNYELPLRGIAIVILLVTYYATIKSLNTECKVSFSKDI